jgi:hypothetical protein
VFNVFLHPPAERWPVWPYAFRTFSILLGLGVVLLTYATARSIVPHPASPLVPLTATAFAALIPEANFIRASVSNENLADLIGALLAWLLVRHVMEPYSMRRVFWLGVIFGAGLLAKLSVALFLLPVLWVFWVRKESNIRRLLRDLLLFGALAAAVAGWFYLYKWYVYGDPLALTAWRTMLPTDSDWQLTDLFWFQYPFRWLLWSSFWGVYGWQLIWMPDWIYYVFIGVTLLAVGGGLYLIARRTMTRDQLHASGVLVSVVLLMYALVIQASTYLIAWQGREMYPALSSVCVLFGLGLGGLCLGRSAVRPVRAQPWRYRLAVGAAASMAVFLLAVNLYSIIWVVLPALN